MEIRLTEEQRRCAAAVTDSSMDPGFRRGDEVGRGDEGNEKIRKLSPMQKRIARLAVDGNSAKETAVLLKTTECAVKSCMSEIYKKCGIHDVEALCILLDGPVPEGSVFERLAPREQEVVRLLFQARAAKDIAIAMNISEYTVKEYIANIKRKFGFPADRHSNIPKLLKALRCAISAGPELPADPAL